MIAIDLSKQQALDADPKAIQQINFTGNLARHPITNTTMLLSIEEAGQTVLDLFRRNWESILILFFALI